ncbi:leucyl/phenylalanyl-tRNA--protein transferase [Neisseria chenwenguii]|uniref:Leucyl/phenylalanyl-tRNA--protein transferase n=1 Tax=Neisseria chenwenguii TaxID=1853278 RepID=A0A220S1Y0_9NEIS|nr:leucyl/phenylalanyl-tRNA--protein transferase [Neisseria chenwenguii]ASK27484.1 leucyl/phenylalanyl-tRNA--protein transferase [Neisseria chenwenguii]
MNIPFLPPQDYRFPNPDYALEHCDGLVGVSADLDRGRLLSAYRSGIFPWFSQNGLFYWFATAPRTVLFPEKLHIGKSLAKTLRNKPYRVTADQTFGKVIAHCAAVPRPGQDGTWIVPEFQTAYTRLHESGHAHSFECWYPDEQGRLKLAGGFYGVQIGSVFYGESMFALAPDASKIAFACAVPYLAERGVQLIDCQQDTEHLARFGSEQMDFHDFQTALRDLNGRPLCRNIGGTVCCNCLPNCVSFR